LLIAVSSSTFAAQFDEFTKPKAAVSSPYTEDAARHIAESHGFYGIGRLVLDDAGTWRGTAIQFGRIVRIEVDQRGNFSGIEKR